MESSGAHRTDESPILRTITSTILQPCEFGRLGVSVIFRVQSSHSKVSVGTLHSLWHPAVSVAPCSLCAVAPCCLCGILKSLWNPGVSVAPCSLCAVAPCSLCDTLKSLGLLMIVDSKSWEKHWRAFLISYPVNSKLKFVYSNEIFNKKKIYVPLI